MYVFVVVVFPDKIIFVRRTHSTATFVITRMQLMNGLLPIVVKKISWYIIFHTALGLHFVLILGGMGIIARLMVSSQLELELKDCQQD